MYQQFLQGVSPKERIQVLRDSAEKVENFTYPKKLSGDDLSLLKDDMVRDSVQLAKLEDAKKEFNTEHKSQVKPLKQNFAITLNKLRSKVEEVTEEVYLMADQEEGLMGYYNGEGNLIHSRVLRPEEKQFRIVDMSKTGTK
jgi:hypothetical protein